MSTAAPRVQLLARAIAASHDGGERALNAWVTLAGYDLLREHFPDLKIATVAQELTGKQKGASK